MAFEQLRQLLDEADVQQVELTSAEETLTGVKAELVEIQTQLAAKQESVAQAQSTVNTERADVIAALTAIVSRCNEILTNLQA